jgi:hypothetical protein
MRFAVLFGMTVLCIPVLLLAFSSRRACDPPGLQSCFNGCHDSFPLNSGNGSLSILGVPPSYNPDSTYNITITIEDPGQERWGFEVTTLDSVDCQAGVFIVTDTDSTQLSDNTGCNPDYMKHTDLGTHAGVLDGPVSWRFDWQAPGSGTGIVTFYASGVAANDGSGSNGDYVYCASVTSDEIIVGVDEEVSHLPVIARLNSSVPNPFNRTTSIFYNLPVDAYVTLDVYDIIGERVGRLVEEYQESGYRSVVWEGRDNRGTQVPKGVYFIRLMTQSDFGRFTSTRKLVVMR